MKWFLMICILTGSLVTFIGCNGGTHGIEVVIEGGGQFPPELAGTWKSIEGGWEIVFEPSGCIASIVHTMGRIRIYPGKTTKVPMRMGGKSIFEPGEWIVDYDPESRQLTVMITLDTIYAEIGEGTVQGSGKDIFVGPVSEDGQTWPVVWTRYATLTGNTREHPNVDMSTPYWGDDKDMVFEKVSEE